MDKSWMTSRRFSDEHVKGVQSFMKFVRDNMGAKCDIRCPCVDCLNVRIHSQDVVSSHLLFPGINKFYTRWIYHGEPRDSNINKSNEGLQDTIVDDVDTDVDEDDGLQDMLDDMNDCLNSFQEDNNDSGVCNALQFTKESFTKLLREAQQELYPSCSTSTLSTVVNLLHMKVYNKWSNKSFDMLLNFLKTILPKGETLPKSHYEAKSMLRELGLGYISIHACKYDCALFWKDFEDHKECPICGTSRWKVNDGKGKKIPHKILRYFPLKPRLQRLFMSKRTAVDMRWHKEKRINDDNVMQHPADSKAWKHFDSEFPWFEEDCRNVRLGLATDGFNPFGHMNNSYSMWPVILIPYNLEDEQNVSDEAYQEVESNSHDYVGDIEEHEIEQLHRNDPHSNIIDGNLVQNLRDEQVDSFLVDDDHDEDETLYEYCIDEDDAIDIDVDPHDDDEEDDYY